MTGTVITISDCRLGFPGSTPLIQSLSVRIRAGRRYGLVGPNGSGKSTLLQLLMGEQARSTGHLERTPGHRTAMLSQTPRDTDPRQFLVDRVQLATGIGLEEAGSLLAMVLMRDWHLARVGQLSVGELRRVDVAITFACGANLMLLDEPSNHLDVPTLDMVDEALTEYCGAAVVVSHDRRLLTSAGLDELWMITEQELRCWDLRQCSLHEVLETLHW